jgi:hypothetical protein
MKPPISLKTWQALHRMHANGTPVDLDYLYRIMSPLQVKSLPPVETLPIQPHGDGFVFTIDLSLAVTAPAIFEWLSIEADWLRAPVEWPSLCNQHRDHYCLHPAIRIPVEESIQAQLLSPDGVRPGRVLRGVLAGFVAAPPPVVRLGTRLEASLEVQDLFGFVFHYNVSVFETTQRDGEERDDEWRTLHQATV